jgi:predicted ATPase/class 3 adenylate cyclase
MVMGLPTGTVTFLFSDIEGSTRLAQEVGPERWAAVLAGHDRIVDDAVAKAGGVVVKHEGDGMFAAFASPHAAVRAASAITLATTPMDRRAGPAIAVRVGVHTGVGQLTASGVDYVGIDVNYAARVAAAANGGQVVLSEATVGLLGDAPFDGTLRDDGLHRVKDFETPRRMFVLIVEDGPDDPRPLRTLRAPTNLPDRTSAFVGRGEEADAVAGLVADGRLITITGPGGVGKTRLAVEAANRVTGEFPDGTWFIDLAPLDDAELVVTAVADAIGIEEEVDRPIADSVLEALRTRRCLLVMDNFESVMAATRSVTRILANARDVKVIVTSREPLRISGERVVVLQPLPLDDAVALFVARAREVRAEFRLTASSTATVRAICERLDGLPLGIELAAARMRVYSPERILARLSERLDELAGRERDRSERQRTLRGTISWSHDLLEPGEQVVFRRLGAFAAGWTVEGAEVVVDPDRELELPIADAIVSLVDKSLVTEDPTDHGEPRFRMLSTIAEFARERLDGAGERAMMGRRHAVYIAGLAVEAAPILERGDPGMWLDRLGHELHEIRATLAWSLADDVDVGLRLAGGCWRFWQHRSLLREGLDWCDRLLARHDGSPTRERFGGLMAAAGLAYWLADHEVAERRYLEANEIAEILDDDRARADARFGLGFIPMVRQQTERLRELHGSALDLYERLGDQVGAMEARQGLTVLAFLEGDWAGAHALAQLVAEDHRRTGARYRLADAESLLAAASIGLGDPAGAQIHMGNAIAIERELGLMASLTGSLIIGAVIANEVGDHRRAARLVGAVEVLKETLGMRSSPAIDVLHLPDPTIDARRMLGTEAFTDAVVEGRSLTLDASIDLALQGRGAVSERH